MSQSHPLKISNDEESYSPLHMERGSRVFQSYNLEGGEVKNIIQNSFC